MQQYDDEEEIIKSFLKRNGFKRSLTARFGYTPPYPHPGGLAPAGDNGDPEVRKRVLEERRQTRYGNNT